jgi:branched-chain amino acid transport system substrate-binding protein
VRTARGGRLALIRYPLVLAGVTAAAVTAAAVKAQLALSTPRAVPFSGDITFACNGTAIPLLPSVCSATTDVGTVASTGAISRLQAYNPTPLFKA